jgi:uncharacterized protein (TIGR01244 family)
MRSLSRNVVFLIALASPFLVGCQGGGQTAAEQPQPPDLADWEDFRPDSESANAYIGAQPTPEALAAFREAGGTVVINLRTEREMAFLPYYADLVSGEGLTYVHIPTRGSQMDAKTYDAVREAIDAAEGPVMLHCGSGGRATYLWGGHLVRAYGRSPDQAKAWCADFRGEDISKGGEAAIDRIANGETFVPEGG